MSESVSVRNPIIQIMDQSTSGLRGIDCERRAAITSLIEKIGFSAGAFFGVLGLVCFNFSSSAGEVAMTFMVIAFVFGTGAWHITGHHFLLSPRRYWNWIRRVPPFQPESIWGQTIQEFSSWLGAILGLVASATFGAILASASNPDELLEASRELFVVTVIFAVLYGFWSRLIFRLWRIHVRARRDGTLLPRPKALKQRGLWQGFAALWLLGILAGAVAIAFIVSLL